MNREDIIRIALEAEFTTFDSKCDRLHHFANLIAAAEREACYGIAMSEAAAGGMYGWPECAYTIAKAIEKRGDK